MSGIRQTDFPASSCAFVGVGSNQGDRFALLGESARRLAALPGVLEVTSSPVYETRPLGPVGSEPFLNAVFQLSLRSSPSRVFRQMQDIETTMGRRPPRSGPRPIDLDLLFYDDLVFQSELLIVPHPRAHLRAFVLQPMCDLDSTFCHPEVGLTVAELREALGGSNEVLGRVAETVYAEGVTSGTHT